MVVIIESHTQVNDKCTVIEIANGKDNMEEKRVFNFISVRDSYSKLKDEDKDKKFLISTTYVFADNLKRRKNKYLRWYIRYSINVSS